MSKVLVTKAKVDTIADKITALVDDTSKKTLDEMATSLNGVGLEVAEQEDLIAQIKSTVDSLPEAGGGSLETCTVTFTLDGSFMVPNVFIVTYMNSSSQIATTEISIGDSITCLKNSIIAVQNCPLTTSLSGGLSKIFYAQMNWAIQVSSDGTLYIAG